MKKVILSSIMMLFLMSFAKMDKIQDKKELFSPECFDFADSVIEELHMAGWSWNDYEMEHTFWESQYNWCEANSNNDEFQFPPL